MFATGTTDDEEHAPEVICILFHLIHVVTRHAL